MPAGLLHQEEGGQSTPSVGRLAKVCLGPRKHLLDQHVRYLKADADDPREQANHDMRFVLRSAFQLLRAARVTKLELIVRASTAEPRPQQAAWVGSRPSASTPRREV
jgi:hypothetical protein